MQSEKQEKTHPLVERVNKLYTHCILDEKKKRGFKIEGVHRPHFFHAQELYAHTSEIKALLGELSVGLRKEFGGLTLMQVAFDKNNIQWTNAYEDIERLMALAMAIGKIEYRLPRAQWHTLPTGLPIYIMTP